MKNNQQISNCPSFVTKEVRDVRFRRIKVEDRKEWLKPLNDDTETPKIGDTVLISDTHYVPCNLIGFKH